MWRKRARTKTTKECCQCATSSVLAIFPQSQSQVLKEAFTMIDQNSVGFVDREDLLDLCASLGSIQQLSI